MLESEAGPAGGVDFDSLLCKVQKDGKRESAPRWPAQALAAAQAFDQLHALPASGMIARELLDRGIVRRLAVLTLAHLCDQWERELREKFAIETVLVQPCREFDCKLLNSRNGTGNFQTRSAYLQSDERCGSGYRSRESATRAAASCFFFAASTFGYARLRVSMASTIAAATTSRVNHLLSAGTTNHGACFDAVSCRQRGRTPADRK